MRKLLESVGHSEKASCLAAVFCVGVLTGCGTPHEKPAVLSDAAVSESQSKLLQISFDVVSQMPLKPHIKDRARAQERVVNACFELQQPQTALTYIDQIPNWRRGLGYANYAFYSVENGVTNNVEILLQKAESIGTVATQEWRRDKIIDGIDQVRALLSNEWSGLPKAGGADAGRNIDSEFSKIDRMVASGELESLEEAIRTGCSLYGQFYNDELVRNRIYEKVNTFKGRLPVFIRLQYMEQMVRAALDHNDRSTARRLVSEMGDFISENTWPVEYNVRVLAHLALLQAESGDVDLAASTFDDARALYEQKQSEIVNMEKADALIPLAESALKVCGESTAQTVYRMALDASVENPNSRPRADDLSLTCLSMAMNNVEPGDALWQLIYEIRDALGNPW